VTGGGAEFWAWYAKESTRWFQADIPAGAGPDWDIAQSIASGVVPKGPPFPTLVYDVARGRLTHRADVINTWNLLPSLVGPRVVDVFDHAGLTGAFFVPARVVDRDRGEESGDYCILISTAVIGRRRWTQADYTGGETYAGELRQFRGYPVAPETWNGEDVVRVDGTGWLLVSRRGYDALTRAKLTGLELRPAAEEKLYGSPKDFIVW
jgi:hypothetical protein